MSRRSGKKKASGQGRKKPLIRQCDWCGKILKAGEGLLEDARPFCAPQCRDEYLTRKSIVKKELDGQKSVVRGSGLRIGDIQDPPDLSLIIPPPVSREEMVKGISVSEFLDGRSDAEIEELAARLRVEKKKRLFTPFNTSALALLLLMAALLFLSEKRKSQYLHAVMKIKGRADQLNSDLNERIRASVPLDTSALVIRYPENGLRQPFRYIRVSGTGKDSLSLTLLVNGQVRGYASMEKGAFSFYRAYLKPGENAIMVKGVDNTHRYYEKQVVVYVGRDTLPAADRRIDYTRPQQPVANEYERTLNYTRGPVRKKEVALTFDGSAHAGEASQILDTLKSRGVRATMFLSGDFIRTFPDLVRRMHAEGHVLANHTESHPHLTTWEQNNSHNVRQGVTREYLLDQLGRVKEKYARLGVPMALLWRAPYGEQNRTINAWAESAGYRHVGWTAGGTWRTNLDTNDWVVQPGDKGYFTPEEIIRKILSFGTGTPDGLNGGIILLHIGTLRKEGAMVTRLGELMDSLKAQGYGMVTLAEMMAGSVD